MGDTGLTGRKIIVDTYGGMGRHGGGAFSGKDPTKVDRSAAYMARHIAKNVVAGGLAGRCEVQLAYAIGVADPVSVLVETFGTAKVDPEIIPDLIRAHFKLTPRGIIDSLNLRRPIYKKTAAYGHFGRSDADFTWEATDKAAKLASDAGVRATRGARPQVARAKSPLHRKGHEKWDTSGKHTQANSGSSSRTIQCPSWLAIFEILTREFRNQSATRHAEVR